MYDRMIAEEENEGSLGNGGLTLTLDIDLDTVWNCLGVIGLLFGSSRFV